MQKGYWQTVRQLNRDVRLYLGMFVIIGMSAFGIQAVVYNLYLVRLGYGPQLIGAVNGVTFVTLGALSPLSGWLGRRYGSRRMLIAGLMAAIAAGVIAVLPEAVPVSIRTPFILFGSAFSGLTGALVTVNAPPLLMKLTTPEERSHAFSLQIAAMRLSGFGGNLVAGLLPALFAALFGMSLQQPGPYRFPLMINPVLSVLGLLMVLGIRKTETAVERPKVGSRGRPPALLFLVLSAVFLLWRTGAESARSFFNVYMDQALLAPTALIGTIFAVGQLAAVPAALVTPVLTRRIGTFSALVVSMTALAASQVALAVLPHWVTAGSAFLALYALFGMTTPMYMRYCQEAVRPEWRSVLTGFTSMSWGLGGAGLLFGGGYIAAALGYRTLFAAGGAMGVTGLLIFWTAFRAPRSEPVQAVDRRAEAG